MFNFESNYSCLDFLNTELVEKNQVVDQIKDYDHLIEWLYQAQFLSAPKAARVRQKWSGTSAEARGLRAAKDLRGLIQHVVEKITGGQKLPSALIDKINRQLRQNKGYVQLIQDGNEFRLQRQIDSKEDPLNLMLPVVESLCRLLVQGDPSRLKRCANPDCIHYFYDISKNQKRRWCSMRLCGNRMKAAAHYRRRKEKERHAYDQT